jgi:hypothetical protein
MIREPFAAPRIEIVVSNAMAARGRVDKAVVARVDRNVAYPASLLEQH